MLSGDDRRLASAVGIIVIAMQAVAAAQSRSVALTFDDLPAVGTLAMADAERCNRRILDALQKHAAPATGFVIERKREDLGAVVFERILKEWTRGGHDLGNHSYSHADVNGISPAQFEQEVVRGEATIRGLSANLGQKPRYFRFPFNHTGETEEKLAAVNASLRRHGYEIATCTIDNSDYEFARAYDLMMERNAATEAVRLRKAYLDFTAAEIDYYTGLHQAVFREEVPHVMLLHLNRLNADVIGELLDLFIARGYRFVTLQEAQSHPAYRTPTTIPSKYGPMWGYRWARELRVKVDGSLEPEPPVWVLQYGRTRQ